MEVLMNRFFGVTFAGGLVLALGLATMGCQGETSNPGSEKQGIEAAKKAAEGMKEMKKKAPPAPPGAVEPSDDDKGKDKDKGKGGDKDKDK